MLNIHLVYDCCIAADSSYCGNMCLDNVRCMLQRIVLHSHNQPLEHSPDVVISFIKKQQQKVVISFLGISGEIHGEKYKLVNKAIICLFA